jgi:hypothetical protein
MDRSFKALAASGVVGIFIGSIIILSPIIGLLPTPDQSLEVGYETETIGGGDIMEPLNENENPVVSVRIPRNIRVSETRLVRAKLEEVIPSVGLMQGRQYSRLRFSASLSSPAFDISPSNKPVEKSDIREVSWEWLIKAKSLGDHAIQVSFDREVITQDSVDKLSRDPRRSNVEATTKSVTAYVTVVDDLGLTARESAWLKAIAAVAAALGTVLGYPLWKRYFEPNKKTAENPAKKKRR